MVIPDTHADPDWVDVPETRWIRSYVCAPIYVEDRLIGFISLSSTNPDTHDAAAATRLQTFAQQAAIAIQNARLFEQVQAGRERLQELSERLVEAQERERRHIARELHDEVGQTLTSLSLALNMAHQLPPESVDDALDEADELVETLTQQVRKLSLDLRPSMLDDLGLLPALLWHLDRYTEHTRIDVDFKHLGIADRDLPSNVETAAYRIVQESLTNVARYAGVDEAEVRVWADEETLNVQVEDQGAGFDPERVLEAGRTTGLAGMRERAVLVGGRLQIDSEPGAGTSIVATLPVESSIERREARRHRT